MRLKKKRREQFRKKRFDFMLGTTNIKIPYYIPVYFVVAKLGCYYPNFESNKIFYISKLGLGPEWLFGINQYW